MKPATDNWRCNGCSIGFFFGGDSTESRCPKCGSGALMRFFTAHDDIKPSLVEHLTLKCKNPAYPSSRRLRREVRTGRRLERSGSGQLVDEWWVADADVDDYEERIIDVRTSRVIRDVKERLSQHRGGSEKRRRDEKS